MSRTSEVPFGQKTHLTAFSRGVLMIITQEPARSLAASAEPIQISGSADGNDHSRILGRDWAADRAAWLVARSRAIKPTTPMTIGEPKYWDHSRHTRRPDVEGDCAMARIDQVGDGIYRISVFTPEKRISFNQFVIDDERPALVHTA